MKDIVVSEQQIVDFLQKGQLGTLDIAMSRREVYKILGNPESVSKVYFGTNRDTEHPTSVIYYGNLNFTVEDDKLIFIAIDYRENFWDFPDVLGIEWPTALRGIDIGTIRQLLKKNRIPYNRAIWPEPEDGIVFVFEGGGQLLFNTREAKQLDKISFYYDGWKGSPVVEDS